MSNMSNYITNYKNVLKSILKANKRYLLKDKNYKIQEIKKEADPLLLKMVNSYFCLACAIV